MRLENRSHQFELPRDLRDKLFEFRRQVWKTKSAEAVSALAILFVASFLCVFVLDRFFDTPQWLRLGLLSLVALGTFVGLPLQLYRWVWKQRVFRQLARLIAWNEPRVGDRLLGIVDLVERQRDDHSSPELCLAAIRQVSDDTRNVDFSTAVPTSRRRLLGRVAAVACIIAGLAVLVPGAGLNALARWSNPWSSTQRYTFAQLKPLPERTVVAIGEPFKVFVPLAEDSVWNPSRGRVSYGGQAAVETEVVDRGYQFLIPAQTEPAELEVSIGDARERMWIEPLSRPELKALTADVRLPNYLGHDDEVRDVRGGVVSLIKGSQARFEAEATRGLAEATLSGQPQPLDLAGAIASSQVVDVDENQQRTLEWIDIEGLSAKSPFKLKIRAVDDQAPTIQCRDLPSDHVVLQEETLAFQVVAADDFGVKEIGVEWAGVADRRNPDPAKGEYLLAGGEHTQSTLDVAGTFSAKTQQIEPQPIHLRVYTEDYLPDRKRVYSPVYRLYVLSREQHLIWVTQQLEQWERQALEVRDEEQRLLETNHELTNLSAQQLDSEATRQRISQQAASERANAARLSALTAAGEQLVGEAARNPEFDVQTLENWAQVMKTLKQLAKNEMPSVASRLAKASNASKSQASTQPANAPSVSDPIRGANRDPEDDQDDEESSEEEKSDESPSGALGLVQSTLQGGKSKSQPSPPAAESMEQAVEEQQALLAEFNRVMDELKEILQNLQGSTFVKRLKAAADSELKIASDLHERLQLQFGTEAGQLKDASRTLLQRLYAVQNDTTRDVRLIQEDLSAFFDRTRREGFKTVRDEMKETEVVKNFKDISELLSQNHSGDVIAQTEYWSDQLDRWAEILVGPAGSAGAT